MEFEIGKTQISGSVNQQAQWSSGGISSGIGGSLQDWANKTNAETKTKQAQQEAMRQGCDNSSLGTHTTGYLQQVTSYKCPCCGYCKHCGRGGSYDPYPYHYPPYGYYTGGC